MSRMVRLRLPVVFVCMALFGVVLLQSAPIQPPMAAAASPAAMPPQLLHGAKVSPGSAAAETDTPAIPPGMTLYVAPRAQSVPALVHQYLPKTRFMTGSELEKAIRAANAGLKGLWLKPGQKVLIPGYEPEVIEKPVPVAKDFEVRAIYLTGTMAGSARGLELVRQWRQLGGNSVVFDIKDSDGLVNVDWDHPLLHASAAYPMESPLAGRTTPPLRNLSKYVRWLHSQDLHAIARIAIFRDEYLATHHPELAVRSRKGPQPWRENGKLVWVDPSNPQVQAYNIALARYAAESGVDEIQFDYVRFPAEGDQKDALFTYEKAHPDWQRTDVLTDFLATTHKELKPLNVLFSLDVFGVMAWQRTVDLLHTGQDIPQMAKQCDVLSPMIYPSHFFGMDNYKVPGDAPEHFISESMDRFRLITKDSGVVLRPWLQAFGWRTRSYSPQYIVTQVQVAKDKGGIGFLFWNARNDYSKPFTAMPEMRAKPGQFFRGDEVKTLKTMASNATPASASVTHD